MGNTNFSIILPRLLFTRAHGAELVAKAVRGLGVEGCTVNSRNDVIIKDGEKELKISPLGNHEDSADDLRFWVCLQDYTTSGISSWDNVDFFLLKGIGQGIEDQLGRSLRSCASNQSDKIAKHRDERHPLVQVTSYHTQSLPHPQ